MSWAIGGGSVVVAIGPKRPTPSTTRLLPWAKGPSKYYHAVREKNYDIFVGAMSDWKDVAPAEK